MTSARFRRKQNKKLFKSVAFWPAGVHGRTRAAWVLGFPTAKPASPEQPRKLLTMAGIKLSGDTSHCKVLPSVHSL